MGRTIKISELKKFDVFKPIKGNLSDIYPDLFYIVFDDGFCCTWNQGYQFSLKKDFCYEEVELLGRMEFVCDGKEDFSYEQDFPLDLPN
jgi:hypothetical protein